ncbi:MAG: cysteine--tRNA ligase, partial [Cytophagales bacterium]|nr:cysteine--tRNA ligase [Cytophaga sp.]
GGMDLLFPHHECEIAQSVAANKKQPARYWIHNNMITINGQKMGKSLGNFITLTELFQGKHELLEQAYTPMTIRFFILQAQYRSTLDFSNDGLKAANKAYRKVMNGMKMLNGLEYSQEPAEHDVKLEEEIKKILDDCYKGMLDDFNTAITLASVFNLIKKINVFYLQQKSTAAISRETFDSMKKEFNALVTDVLGLKDEKDINAEGLIQGLLDLYKEAKEHKQYDKIDQIRVYFKNQGLVIKDMKHGIDWAYEE